MTSYQIAWRYLHYFQTGTLINGVDETIEDSRIYKLLFPDQTPSWMDQARANLENDQVKLIEKIHPVYQGFLALIPYPESVMLAIAASRYRLGITAAQARRALPIKQGYISGRLHRLVEGGMLESKKLEGQRQIFTPVNSLIDLLRCYAVFSDLAWKFWYPENKGRVSQAIVVDTFISLRESQFLEAKANAKHA